MNMSLTKLWEMVKDREAWRAAFHGVVKSQIWLSDWIMNHNSDLILHSMVVLLHQAWTLVPPHPFLLIQAVCNS